MGKRSTRITPRWMKLTDAALYSALGQKKLIALAEEGIIRGFRDPDSGRHDWIFDQESLDEYREGQGASQDAGLSAKVAKELFAAHLERQRKRAAKRK